MTSCDPPSSSWTSRCRSGRRGRDSGGPRAGSGHARGRAHVLLGQRARIGGLAAGAVGYLLKDCDPRDLVAAIRSAAQGYAPLDPRVAGALLPSSARAPGIAERTVKVHVGHVFRQIGVAECTSAALWAREHLPPE